MSLSSSLYTGTSGLKNMGNGMQVVGNNIANTNTVGFKSGRSTFSDTLYENVATQAGTAQMGRGMAVGSVTNNFGQGSFESTGNATDLSIGGDGFFIVRQDGTDNDYYTRAGNFYFDADGKLINQEGYIVQGWELDKETGEDVGAIGDIVLGAFTSPPDATTEVTAITNLDADAITQAVVLSNVWNSTADTYLGSGSYEYQTTVSVYDSLGSAHDVTIYYDKKAGSEWEYVVTCNPEEDNRNLVQGTQAEGLLARGTITFSESSGDILDLTMEEFTGRLGNFTANGVNSLDDIEYNIEDYESIPLDGYGFEFEYDGSSWDFVDQDSSGAITSADKPANYGNATIIYSDSTTIQLAFDGDTEVDLEIKLSQSAVALDSLGFDINAEEMVHFQGLDGVSYEGGAAASNTSPEINDPGVMTHDSKGLGIVWDPTTETWYWSNPNLADSAGTLASDVTLAGVQANSGTVSITNAAAMNMRSSDVNVAYNGTTGEWDWNLPMKDDDFVSEVFDFSPTNDPSLTILTQGTQGAMASTSALGGVTTNTLYWDGSTWAASSGGGQTRFSIDTAASDASQVQFLIWEGAGNSAGASSVLYSFGTDLTSAGGQSIEFSIDPSPPEEFPNAVLTTSGASANGFGIDFDGDSTADMQYVTSADGATTVAAGLTATFDVNPEVPPANYAGATLTGDHTQVIIDLDNSGGETEDDIVFSFENDLPYGTSTDAYDDRAVINFDILGSTAWTAKSDSEVSTDGLFSFTADFLGGEFGTTEQKIELDLGTAYDGSNWINNSLSTTQYSKSSSTTYQDADGYAAGDLEGVDVSSDGTITGSYSNGQLIPLFRVGLAKFYNNYGLYAEGSNLFSETNESGEAITNKPGENGLGTIAPNSLEMSNVDISDQLVKMIEIQRGYQGNSKTITTVDEMLQTVINMK